MSTYSDFTTDATAISKGSISVDTANPINQISFDVGSFLHVMDNTGIFSLDGKQRVINGDVSFPAYSFTNDPTSGMYLTALNQYAFACDGADVIQITNGGPKFNFFRLQDVANPISSSDAATKGYVDTAVGTVAFPLYATPADDETAPSYSWDADSGTGLYNHGGAAIGMAVSGVSRATLDLIGMRVFEVNSTGYGLDNDYSAYDVQTPTNATATWLLTHHNDDLTFRSGIQSHNNDSTVSLYADTNYLLLNSTAGLVLNAGVVSAPTATASNPTYTFTGDTDTGMYSSGSGIVEFTSNGTQKMYINSTEVGLLNALSLAPILTPSSCALYIGTDAGTGLYRAGTFTLGIAAGGVQRLTISTTAATFTNQIVASTGTAAAPSYCFTGDTNTGIYHAVAAETFGFASNGSSKATVDTLGVHIATGNGLYLPDGSAAAPALRFEQDVTNNAGFYRSGTGAVTFASGVGGVDRVKMDANGLTVMGASTGNVKVTYGGSNTAPAYSFVGDPDTGMYSSGGGSLTFASNAVDTFGISGSGMHIQNGKEFRLLDTTNIFCGTDTTGGSSTRPKISWNSNLGLTYDFGFYSDLDRVVKFAVDSNEIFSMSSNAITMGYAKKFYGTCGGTASAPTFAFVDDFNTGIYNPSANSNELRVAAAGVDVLKVTLGNLEVAGGTTITSSYSFVGDTGTGFIRNGSGDVSITCLSSTALNLTTSDVKFPLHSTTASAGNAYLDSVTGSLRRSTSSLKYKQDVVDIEDSSFIYNLRAVSFTPKSDTTIRCDGLIAEEVALVNERYVHMANGEPDGVQYDRLVAPLIAEMQKMNARIAQLEAIIANNH